MGPVFSADCVELVVYTDAAFAVFRDGYSSSGILFCIGRMNAPFQAVAQSQSDVATCPITADYYSSNSACKQILYLSQTLFFLGWQTLTPVPLFLDNKTSIKFIQSPQVSV